MKGLFYRTVEEIGLEVPPHEVIKGMANLRAYLKEHENVFVKMSRYRGTMDTWKHKTYQQSLSYLDLLAVKLGPFQDLVTFYVLDEIKTDIEGGVDTYCIDGQWPKQVVLGYEKKNETYLRHGQANGGSAQSVHQSQRSHRARPRLLPVPAVLLY